MLSFTPRSLYQRYILDVRLGGPYNERGYGKEKISIFYKVREDMYRQLSN